jgi:hypothetical protein
MSGFIPFTEDVLFELGNPVETEGSGCRGSDSVKLEAMVVLSDVMTDSLVGIPVAVIEALTTREVV